MPSSTGAGGRGHHPTPPGLPAPSGDTSPGQRALRPSLSSLHVVRRGDRDVSPASPSPLPPRRGGAGASPGQASLPRLPVSPQRGSDRIDLDRGDGLQPGSTERPFLESRSPLRPSNDRHSASPSSALRSLSRHGAANGETESQGESRARRPLGSTVAGERGGARGASPAAVHVTEGDANVAHSPPSAPKALSKMQRSNTTDVSRLVERRRLRQSQEQGGPSQAQVSGQGTQGTSDVTARSAFVDDQRYLEAMRVDRQPPSPMNAKRGNFFSQDPPVPLPIPVVVYDDDDDEIDRRGDDNGRLKPASSKGSHDGDLLGGSTRQELETAKADAHRSVQTARIASPCDGPSPRRVPHSPINGNASPVAPRPPSALGASVSFTRERSSPAAMDGFAANRQAFVRAMSPIAFTSSIHSQGSGPSPNARPLSPTSASDDRQELLARALAQPVPPPVNPTTKEAQHLDLDAAAVHSLGNSTHSAIMTHSLDAATHSTHTPAPPPRPASRTESPGSPSAPQGTEGSLRSFRRSYGRDGSSPAQRSLSPANQRASPAGLPRPPRASPAPSPAQTDLPPAGASTSLKTPVESPESPPQVTPSTESESKMSRRDQILNFELKDEAASCRSEDSESDGSVLGHHDRRDDARRGARGARPRPRSDVPSPFQQGLVSGLRSPADCMSLGHSATVSDSPLFSVMPSIVLHGDGVPMATHIPGDSIMTSHNESGERRQRATAHGQFLPSRVRTMESLATESLGHGQSIVTPMAAHGHSSSSHLRPQDTYASRASLSANDGSTAALHEHSTSGLTDSSVGSPVVAIRNARRSREVSVASSDNANSTTGSPDAGAADIPTPSAPQTAQRAASRGRGRAAARGTGGYDHARRQPVGLHPTPTPKSSTPSSAAEFSPINGSDSSKGEIPHVESSGRLSTSSGGGPRLTVPVPEVNLPTSPFGSSGLPALPTTQVAPQISRGASPAASVSSLGANASGQSGQSFQFGGDRSGGVDLAGVGRSIPSRDISPAGSTTSAAKRVNMFSRKSRDLADSSTSNPAGRPQAPSVSPPRSHHSTQSLQRLRIPDDDDEDDGHGGVRDYSTDRMSEVESVRSGFSARLTSAVKSHRTASNHDAVNSRDLSPAPQTQGDEPPPRAKPPRTSPSRKFSGDDGKTHRKKEKDKGEKETDRDRRKGHRGSSVSSAEQRGKQEPSESNSGPAHGTSYDASVSFENTQLSTSHVSAGSALRHMAPGGGGSVVSQLSPIDGRGSASLPALPPFSRSSPLLPNAEQGSGSTANSSGFSSPFVRSENRRPPSGGPRRTPNGPRRTATGHSVDGVALTDDFGPPLPPAAAAAMVTSNNSLSGALSFGTESVDVLERGSLGGTVHRRTVDRSDPDPLVDDLRTGGRSPSRLSNTSGRVRALRPSSISRLDRSSDSRHCSSPVSPQLQAPSSPMRQSHRSTPQMPPLAPLPLHSAAAALGAGPSGRSTGLTPLAVSPGRSRRMSVQSQDSALSAGSTMSHAAASVFGGRAGSEVADGRALPMAHPFRSPSEGGAASIVADSTEHGDSPSHGSHSDDDDPDRGVSAFALARASSPAVPLGALATAASPLGGTSVLSPIVAHAGSPCEAGRASRDESPRGIVPDALFAAAAVSPSALPERFTPRQMTVPPSQSNRGQGPPAAGATGSGGPTSPSSLSRPQSAGRVRPVRSASTSTTQSLQSPQQQPLAVPLMTPSASPPQSPQRTPAQSSGASQPTPSQDLSPAVQDPMTPPVVPPFDVRPLNTGDSGEAGTDTLSTQDQMRNLSALKAPSTPSDETVSAATGSVKTPAPLGVISTLAPASPIGADRRLSEFALGGDNATPVSAAQLQPGGAVASRGEKPKTKRTNQQGHGARLSVPRQPSAGSSVASADGHLAPPAPLAGIFERPGSRGSTSSHSLSVTEHRGPHRRNPLETDESVKTLPPDHSLRSLRGYPNPNPAPAGDHPKGMEYLGPLAPEFPSHRGSDSLSFDSDAQHQDGSTVCPNSESVGQQRFDQLDVTAHPLESTTTCAHSHTRSSEGLIDEPRRRCAKDARGAGDSPKSLRSGVGADDALSPTSARSKESLFVTAVGGAAELPVDASTHLRGNSDRDPHGVLSVASSLVSGRRCGAKKHHTESDTMLATMSPRDPIGSRTNSADQPLMDAEEDLCGNDEYIFTDMETKPPLPGFTRPTTDKRTEKLRPALGIDATPRVGGGPEADIHARVGHVTLSAGTLLKEATNGSDPPGNMNLHSAKAEPGSTRKDSHPSFVTSNDTFPRSESASFQTGAQSTPRHIGSMHETTSGSFAPATAGISESSSRVTRDKSLRTDSMSNTLGGTESGSLLLQDTSTATRPTLSQSPRTLGRSRNRSVKSVTASHASTSASGEESSDTAKDERKNVAPPGMAVVQPTPLNSPEEADAVEGGSVPTPVDSRNQSRTSESGVRQSGQSGEQRPRHRAVSIAVGGDDVWERSGSGSSSFDEPSLYSRASFPSESHRSSLATELGTGGPPVPIDHMEDRRGSDEGSDGEPKPRSTVGSSSALRGSRRRPKAIAAPSATSTSGPHLNVTSPLRGGSSRRDRRRVVSLVPGALDEPEMRAAEVRCERSERSASEGQENSLSSGESPASVRSRRTGSVASFGLVSAVSCPFTSSRAGDDDDDDDEYDHEEEEDESSEGSVDDGIDEAALTEEERAERRLKKRRVPRMKHLRMPWDPLHRLSAHSTAASPPHTPSIGGVLYGPEASSSGSPTQNTPPRAVESQDPAEHTAETSHQTREDEADTTQVPDHWTDLKHDTKSSATLLDTTGDGGHPNVDETATPLTHPITTSETASEGRGALGALSVGPTSPAPAPMASGGTSVGSTPPLAALHHSTGSATTPAHGTTATPSDRVTAPVSSNEGSLLPTAVELLDEAERQESLRTAEARARAATSGMAVSPLSAQSDKRTAREDHHVQSIEHSPQQQQASPQGSQGDRRRVASGHQTRQAQAFAIPTVPTSKPPKERQSPRPQDSCRSSTSILPLPPHLDVFNRSNTSVPDPQPPAAHMSASATPTTSSNNSPHQAQQFVFLQHPPQAQGTAGGGVPPLLPLPDLAVTPSGPNTQPPVMLQASTALVTGGGSCAGTLGASIPLAETSGGSIGRSGLINMALDSTGNPGAVPPSLRSGATAPVEGADVSATTATATGIGSFLFSGRDATVSTATAITRQGTSTIGGNDSVFQVAAFDAAQFRAQLAAPVVPGQGLSVSPSPLTSVASTLHNNPARVHAAGSNDDSTTLMNPRMARGADLSVTSPPPPPFSEGLPSPSRARFSGVPLPPSAMPGADVEAVQGGGRLDPARQSLHPSMGDVVSSSSAATMSVRGSPLLPGQGPHLNAPQPVLIASVATNGGSTTAATSPHQSPDKLSPKQQSPMLTGAGGGDSRGRAPLAHKHGSLKSSNDTETAPGEDRHVQ